jgi:hypothetical protein
LRLGGSACNGTKRHQIDQGRNRCPPEQPIPGKIIVPANEKMRSMITAGPHGLGDESQPGSGTIQATERYFYMLFLYLTSKTRAMVLRGWE